MYLGIIGTAGRREDADKMNKELYFKMYDKALEILKELNPTGTISAVSGGAAWSDHIAVSLFMREEVDRLFLHLPCKFENGKFVEKTGKADPGRTANYYHQQFSRAMNGSTLKAIQLAREKGAHFTVSNGFKERNLRVGTCTHLIAFTWGSFGGTYTKDDKGWKSSSEAGLKDGGTAHTWNNSDATVKYHIPLSSLI